MLDDIAIKNANGIRYMFKRPEPRLEVVFEGPSSQSTKRTSKVSVTPVPVQLSSRSMISTAEVKWLTPLEINPFSFAHTASNVNDHMFIFGGYADELTSNHCLLLSETSQKGKFNKIRVSGDIPSPRERHSSSLIGKKIFVFGGYNRGPELYYNSLYYLDSETLTWYKVEPKGVPPERRCGHTSCVIDGKIWIFGGRGKYKQSIWNTNSENLCYMSDLYCYDPASNEWYHYEPRGLGPSGRALHTATAVGRKMYIFGGANSSGTNEVSGFCDLYELDIDTMTWTECEARNTPPLPCYGHSATYIGDNKILYFGGKGYTVHNLIHTLCLSTMTWQEYAYGGNTLSPRWGHSAVLNGPCIILYGGRSQEGYYNSIEIINIETELIEIKLEEQEKEKIKRKKDEKNHEREAIMNLQNSLQELQIMLRAINDELMGQKQEIFAIFDRAKTLRTEQAQIKNLAARVLREAGVV